MNISKALLSLYLILVIIPSWSIAKDSENDKRITISKIGENSYRMRLYLNFENPYEKQMRFTENGSNNFEIKLPVPDRFNLKNLRASIRYKASLSIEKKASSISIVANKNFVKQFGLIGGYRDEKSVKSEIPISYLRDGYNTIGIHIFQEGFKEGKGTSSGGSLQSYSTVMNNLDLVAEKVQELKDNQYLKNTPSSKKQGSGSMIVAEVWSQINLEDSYIEIDFEPKLFEEKISSIYKFMFDNKNVYIDNINFVFPKLPSENDFTNYSIVANAIGNILKFRQINFHVSTEVVDNMNNVLIGNFENLKDTLKSHVDFENSDLDRESGTISLLRNINSKTKGLLLITGGNQQNIRKALLKLFDPELKIYDKKSLSVDSDDINIVRSRPYSAPNFLPLGEKIYFSDLGFKSLTLVGGGLFHISHDFKLYPTVRFRKGIDFIKAKLKYFSSDRSKMSKTFNFCINSVFIHQYIDYDDLNSFENTYRDTGEILFSPNLLNGGGDISFGLDITTNLKDSLALPSDLRLTLKDDSYFILPKGESYTELPNLKYISELGFPFSVYPDLQDTGIVVTDFNSQTIASAMTMAFKLGRNIQYPGYFLKTTYDINSISDRNIIVVGKQIEDYKFVYQNAPIRFTKNGLKKSMFDKVSGKTFEQEERVDFYNFIIAQTYKSPFNPKKIIFEITAKDPQTLYKGIKNGLNPQRRGTFDGDVWLYNTETEEAHSYRFKEKYIVKSLLDCNRDYIEPIYVEEL